MPGTYLATQDGVPVSASNPLPTTATLNAGDIEIGAVEIKNSTDDTRATVGANGLHVEVRGSIPAASALSDATANPTTPLIGAALEGYNGTTWDRLRVDAQKNLLVGLRNSAGADLLASLTDGVSSGGSLLGSGSYLYNGASWDRDRNNTDIAVLASASRTVTTSSADLTNYNGEGVHVVLDMTVVGTGSVTLKIEGKDALSGKYYTILEGAAVTTNSTNVYKVFPGAPATANVSANDIIPRTYRITVTANNANAATYSVSASLKSS